MVARSAGSLAQLRSLELTVCPAVNLAGKPATHAIAPPAYKFAGTIRGRNPAHVTRQRASAWAVGLTPRAATVR
jgi:hypothetical protein